MALEPPSSSIITLLRYRGPRPPRPYRATSYLAAPSMVTPTRGYWGVAPPNCKHFLVRTQSTPEAGQLPRPVNSRGRSTPGVWSMPETWPSPFSSHCAPDGSHQVLTLVNARGRVGTISY